MKIPQSALHISIISIITLFLLFGSIVVMGRDFLMPVNYFFTYRTGVDPSSGTKYWQDSVYKHSISPKSKIVLITIDEKTLNTYQSDKDAKILTIPKTSYTRLIDELDHLGAKGIAFDIIFQNPDEHEAAFANKIQNSTNTVIAVGMPTQKLKTIKSDLEKQENDPCLKTGYEKICPLTPREAYKDVTWGVINKNPDSKGTKIIGYDIIQTKTQIWKVNGKRFTKDGYYVYTLALALVKDQTSSIITELKKRAKEKPRLFEPKDKNYILNQYMGPPNSYHRISLVDFLSHPEKYRDTIENAYVFVGESGETLHDLVISPVNEQYMPGVESHAHTLDAILQKKVLFRANETIMFLLYIVLSICFVAIYYFVPHIFGPTIALIATVAVIWYSRYLYDQPRILVDILPLLLSVSLLSYPLTSIYQYFVVDRQKRRIMSSFGRYISPKVVRMIRSNQIEARLGGEKKELSILFSDIAGFTALSENMEAKDLFTLMTSYLSYMTEILLNEGGTLDKYIGDAVMGFFGAPVEQADHAIRACTTALRMRSALDTMNTEIVVRGINPINFRVGIATGEVMVGNIGSAKRFNYTVLGDRVNLASRLEAAGKEYKVDTIIAHNTWSQIDSRFFCRELDTIAVQGKQQGIRIFELVNFSENIKDKEIYTIYEKALLLYRKGEYTNARALWNTQAEIDPPSHTMAVRCTRILNREIRIDNAIYRMEHK